MKTINILILTLIFSFKIQAQSSVTTTTLYVKGNCGECKDRIENAADIKGVKNCNWNEDTQTATITFDSKKTTVETIEKAIAKAGHETMHERPDTAAYKSLPDCCKYYEKKPHKD